jgi:hypothetical protein
VAVRSGREKYEEAVEKQGKARANEKLNASKIFGCYFLCIVT